MDPFPASIFEGLLQISMLSVMKKYSKLPRSKSIFWTSNDENLFPGLKHISVAFPRGFNMRWPGYMHSAWFMASSISLLKLQLLSQSRVMSDREQTVVMKMAQIVALLDRPYYLKSRLSTSAPSPWPWMLPLILCIYLSKARSFEEGDG